MFARIGCDGWNQQCACPFDKYDDFGIWRIPHWSLGGQVYAGLKSSHRPVEQFAFRAPQWTLTQGCSVVCVCTFKIIVLFLGIVYIQLIVILCTYSVSINTSDAFPFCMNQSKSRNPGIYFLNSAIKAYWRVLKPVSPSFFPPHTHALAQCWNCFSLLLLFLEPDSNNDHSTTRNVQCRLSLTWMMIVSFARSLGKACRSFDGLSFSPFNQQGRNTFLQTSGNW
jgi:hypothetical protein